MTTILVTGASGQIGRSLAALSPAYPQYDFIFCDRQEIDLSQPAAIRASLAKHQPHYLINTAAYTAVDKAESEPALAHAINAEAISHLTVALAPFGGHLIHYSSDYVYGGHHSSPISESAPNHPTSAYAESKLQGDLLAQQYPLSTILRTSWVYSPYGHNFVKTMLRLGQTKDQLTIVADQKGTPSYAPDIAKATLDIIDRIEATHPEDRLQYTGVFHCSNTGHTNWYEFAQSIFALSGIEIDVKPIPTADYPTAAQRPLYSILDNSKLQSTFGIRLPEWQDSLAICLRELHAI